MSGPLGEENDGPPTPSVADLVGTLLGAEQPMPPRMPEPPSSTSRSRKVIPVVLSLVVCLMVVVVLDARHRLHRPAFRSADPRVSYEIASNDESALAQALGRTLSGFAEDVHVDVAHVAFREERGGVPDDEGTIVRLTWPGGVGLAEPELTALGNAIGVDNLPSNPILHEHEEWLVRIARDEGVILLLTWPGRAYLLEQTDSLKAQDVMLDVLRDEEHEAALDSLR